MLSRRLRPAAATEWIARDPHEPAELLDQLGVEPLERSGFRGRLALLPDQKICDREIEVRLGIVRVDLDCTLIGFEPAFLVAELAAGDAQVHPGLRIPGLLFHGA